MKIYAFAKDPECGIISAYFKTETGRHKCVVWRQLDKFHVCTGMKIDGTLRRYNFTEAQTAAYLAFCKSGAYSIDYAEGIA